MIDRLYVNGVDIQKKFGFWLKWKSIDFPTLKTNYQPIAGADSVLDLTETDGRVYYNQRKISLDMVHPEKAYKQDINGIVSLHGDNCKIAFASDPDHYYIGRIVIDNYDTRERKLSMHADVFPYRFENHKTIYSVTNATKTIVLLNDTMPVTPEVTIEQGCVASLSWKTYTKSISGGGTYYIDGLDLSKKESLPISITATGGTCTISYRKGRL